MKNERVDLEAYVVPEHPDLSALIIDVVRYYVYTLAKKKGLSNEVEPIVVNPRSVFGFFE